jgi:hypothetical protein
MAGRAAQQSNRRSARFRDVRRWIYLGLDVVFAAIYVIAIWKVIPNRLPSATVHHVDVRPGRGGDGGRHGARRPARLVDRGERRARARVAGAVDRLPDRDLGGVSRRGLRCVRQGSGDVRAGDGRAGDQLVALLPIVQVST